MLMLLSVHMTIVLFLVRFNNFALTMGFYWSYSSRPFLCALAHVLFLKIKLNARHTTPKAMPAVARTEKMTVRERSTDTTSSVGTPSYGASPPETNGRNGESESMRK